MRLKSIFASILFLVSFAHAGSQKSETYQCTLTVEQTVPQYGRLFFEPQFEFDFPHVDGLENPFMHKTGWQRIDLVPVTKYVKCPCTGNRITQHCLNHFTLGPMLKSIEARIYTNGTHQVFEASVTLVDFQKHPQKLVVNATGGSSEFKEGRLYIPTPDRFFAHTINAQTFQKGVGRNPSASLSLVLGCRLKNPPEESTL